MSYFYYPLPFITGESIQLSREESQHIAKSFRAKVNDRINLLNGNGEKALAEIVNLPRNKGHIDCKIIEAAKIKEPSNKISLYLAPPRHNILTGLIKQCVELGIWDIHFIECEYSVAKPKDKMKTLEKDLIAGAKQSGNPFFPKIYPLKNFKTALASCHSPKIIGAVPEDNFPDYRGPAHSSTSIWIGPEGGFSQSEKDLLKESETQAICIGEWILRVETAVVGLCSIVNH